MLRVPCLLSGAAALCLPAAAALADLTAEQAWEEWRAGMTRAGYSVAASEAAGADSVALSGVTLATDAGDGGALVVALGEVRLAERGDGTVAVELPGAAEVTMRLGPEAGEAATVAMDFTQAAPSLVISGDPGDLAYAYAADSARLALRDFAAGGVPVFPRLARLDATMTDLAWTVRASSGDPPGTAQDMTVARIDYGLALDDPEGVALLSYKGAWQGVALKGTHRLPPGAGLPGPGAMLDPGAIPDLNAMLDEGFAVAASISATGGSHQTTVGGESSAGYLASATSGDAKLDASLGPGGLLYDVALAGVETSMLLAEPPLSMSYSAEEIGARLQMPLRKSSEEQDFGLAARLRGFSMSDAAWDLLDPSARLPRDPATLVVDLGGRARVLFDFLDPAAAGVLERAGAMPAEIGALEINRIEVEAAGARLEAAGGFVFDNADTRTFAGMPRPEGAVDLTLSGGDGLLDALVGAGLLPQGQAVAARLMLAMLAAPGEGEDVLQSRIEVNGEGHVLANGRRVR